MGNGEWGVGNGECVNLPLASGSIPYSLFPIPYLVHVTIRYCVV